VQHTVHVRLLMQFACRYAASAGMSDPVMVTVGGKRAMEAADIKTIQHGQQRNGCRRGHHGHAMAWSAVPWLLNPRRQRLCVALLSFSGRARQRSEVKCCGLTKCWPTSTYRLFYVNSYTALERRQQRTSKFLQRSALQLQWYLTTGRHGAPSRSVTGAPLGR
jgi:hypothetical protein